MCTYGVFIPVFHRFGRNKVVFADMLMFCWMLLLLLAASIGEATRQNREKRVHGKGLHPNDFLQHFGYFPKGRYPLQNFRQARKTAVSLYQEHFGLKITRKLNQQTWSLMQKPRCGNPDVRMPSLSDVTSSNKKLSHQRIKRSSLKKADQIDTYEYRWLQRSISWSATRLYRRMSASSQWTALKKAFEVWSEPSQLTLTFDPVNPDIRVSFLQREHGDGRTNAFDGRGGLLAHAFPPGDQELSGDIHFDSDEKWSVGGSSSRRSKDLLMVAMHEVGHAIGLGHSSRPKDIMYPMYGSYTPDPFLSRHDVKRLRRLYGKNPAFKWVPPPSTSPAKGVPQSSKRRNTPRWCRTPFNDVIKGPHGRSHIFSKRYVYRLDGQGVEQGYPVHVRQEFPGAPINPQAVVHVREGTLTFFFKGKRLWRFTDHKLDEGYPRVLTPPFPEKPRAALSVRSRKGYSTVYVFGSRFFWQWNPDTERVSSAFLFISTFWPDLPSKIDAAVHWSDTYIYFFKNNKYYKFSKNSYRLQKGYPKFKGAAWLRGACGKKPK